MDFKSLKYRKKLQFDYFRKNIITRIMELEIDIDKLMSSVNETLKPWEVTKKQYELEDLKHLLISNYIALGIVNGRNYNKQIDRTIDLYVGEKHG